MKLISRSNKTRTIYIVVLTLTLMAASLAQTTLASAAPGDSAIDPIHITNCEGLQDIDDDLDAFYILDNDINCDVAPFNAGEGFVPIGRSGTGFIGSLDGNDKVIDGLYIDTGDEDAGIFGTVAVGGEVKDLGVINVDILSSDSNVGALAGFAEGTITNCHSSGSINGYDGDATSVGGLVGDLGEGNISDSHSSVNITEGNYYIGGLVGAADGGTIENSYASGSIEAFAGYAGGLVGYNYSTISDSYATGDVVSLDNYGGGFSGWAAGPITRSYATGDVTSIDGYYMGGFAGAITEVTISESYSTGQAAATDEGEYVGGFVGHMYGEGVTEDTYARGNASGNDYVGGYSGSVVFSDVDHGYSTGVPTSTGDQLGGFSGEVASGGTTTNSLWDADTSGTTSNYGDVNSKTTSQMKTQSTFTTPASFLAVAFDFDTIWTIDADLNNGYPIFRWQVDIGDSIDNGEQAGLEDAGPNGGDANGDGILDSEQDHVLSLPSSVTGNYVAIEASDDCVVSTNAVTAESTSAEDIAYDYPQGLVNFSLTDCVSGATVTLFFYNVNNSAFVLRKFTEASGSYSTITSATLSATTNDGNSMIMASYFLADNGELDANPVIGTIVDPVGLGMVAVGAPRTGGGGTAK